MVHVGNCDPGQCTAVMKVMHMHMVTLIQFSITTQKYGYAYHRTSINSNQHCPDILYILHMILYILYIVHCYRKCKCCPVIQIIVAIQKCKCCPIIVAVLVFTWLYYPDDGQLVCRYSLGSTLVLITKQFFVTDKVIQTTSPILSTY